MQKQNFEDVLGHKISGLAAEVVSIEPNTKEKTFRFFVAVASGSVLVLDPSDAQVGRVFPEDGEDPAVRLVSGAHPVGQKIVDIVRNVSPSPEKQIAVLLESGSIAMNARLCGGASVLHVETCPDVVRIYGNDWVSEVSGAKRDLTSPAF